MSVVRVRPETARYEVRVGKRLLGRAGPLARSVSDAASAVLVTDRTVGRLYGGPVSRSLERSGFQVFRSTLPDGERAKSFVFYRGLCERWSRARLGRDTLVVALGGGVVSDVAGFAAATFARGLSWVVFPTTVLAQSDAAIGGKVGIDLADGKNLVGAFHHPLAVFADIESLKTLSPRAYRAGLAEVVKMGVIRRPEILARLTRLARRTAWKRPVAIEGVIRWAAAEKAWFVEQDERDHGIRRALNFGHTVGHALETAYGYRRYLHGEAVAIGMAAALRWSVLEAGLDPVDAYEVEMLLGRLGLPTRLDEAPGSRFWGALSRDKKRGRKNLRVVLCPRIGKSKVFEISSLTTLRRVVLSLVRRGVGEGP